MQGTGESRGSQRMLALHACCGPCLLEPYDALASSAGRTVVVFANPNIAPRAEYERRRDTLMAYARDEGIDVVEVECVSEAWHEAVAGATTREERCRACYDLRMRLAATWAAENGFDALATTLTVSPYQNVDDINDAGERAAAAAGVAWVATDFRERYREATVRSRDLGMYRQNYCGCAPSQAEAEAEREARRAARKAARAAEGR